MHLDRIEADNSATKREKDFKETQKKDFKETIREQIEKNVRFVGLTLQELKRSLMIAESKQPINTNGGPTETEAVLKNKLDKRNQEIIAVRSTLTKMMED